ncbi:hypothetical protein HK105_200507 [Polyrhizophydium stewartii]|uniref:GDP/GTP exchange factor Sec2 N-terminal domain-containing protein n=1 Tax=Polyrhizophydium stewartii TaxID=2732419 RepID=A0ABR4NJ80_9FUNG
MDALAAASEPRLEVGPAEHAARLENELSELAAARASEKGDLLDTIAKKNQLIDSQRIKLNRYEFAIKEAVLFLGKPLLAYDDWLNGKEGADPLAAVSSAVAAASKAATGSAPAQSTPGGSYSYASAEHQKSRPATANGPQGGSAAAQPAHAKIPSNPAQLAGRQQAAQKLGSPGALRSQLPANVSALESQCLECMRIALNFLHSAQNFIRSIDNGSYAPMASLPPLQLAENESLALLNVSSPSPRGSPIMRRATSGTASPRISRSDLAPSAKTASDQPAMGKPAQAPAFDLRQPHGVGSGSIPRGPSLNAPHFAAGSRPEAAAKSRGEDDNEDEGDLSTKSASPESHTAVSPKKTRCESCREHMLQIDHLRDQICELQGLAQRAERERDAEKSAKARILQSKENIDQELEDLTVQLFEQANTLVADHARRRDEAETAFKDLKARYQLAVKKLHSREDELKELKKKLYDVQGTQMHTTSFSHDHRDSTSSVGPGPALHALAANDGSSAASLSQAAASAQLQRPSGHARQPSADIDRHVMQYSHTIVAGYDTFESSVAADGVIFQEFQDHVKASILAASQPALQAIQTTYSTAFMKRCMAESVEPCLFYTYQQPTSGFAKAVYGPGLTTSFKKRLVECAVRGQCEIKLVAGFLAPRMSMTVMLPGQTSSQPAHAADRPSQAPLQLQPQSSSPGSSSPAAGAGDAAGGSQRQTGQAVPKDRCTLCTIVRDCEYAVRLLPVAAGTKEWTPLCRFCRDRLASVLDFCTYTNFMIQGTIGPGKQGATILSIFRQMLWLRRRMAVAKIGSCSMFETPLSAITGPGGGGDWEADIKILS